MNNINIYCGSVMFDEFDKALREAFEQSQYVSIISSINWRMNKKYFKNK